MEAPFDAFVLEVLKRPGEVVREGEPIVRIANARRVRVEGYIDVADAGRLRRGSLAAVRIEADGRAAVANGSVIFVDLKVEPVSGKVRVWAEIANEEGHLRDGLVTVLHIDPTRIVRPARAAPPASSGTPGAGSALSR